MMPSLRFARRLFSSLVGSGIRPRKARRASAAGCGASARLQVPLSGCPCLKRTAPLFFAFLLAAGTLAAQQPTVSNVQAGQLAGTKLVDIAYDLAISGEGTAMVTVKASRDGGATFETVPTASLTGAFGLGQSAGTGKAIVWDVGSIGWEDALYPQAQVEITATVGAAVVAGFSLIPAGTFAMGDHKNESEWWMAMARPVHDVYVSAFYMAQTPVTYAEWKEIYDWAVANGYTFDSPGQRGSDASGSALPDSPEHNQHPVTWVSWYDVVKWCNAKTERENQLLGANRTPAYYTNDERTTVYRQGQHDVTITQLNWNADGYRLPTEAEWEKTARGGLVGARWPWGDAEIDGTRANYGRIVNSTTPVASYAANGYGLYDMAGNVSEWNWDWFSRTWYQQEGATGADTRGPVSGDDRVNRNADWSSIPQNRVAFRYGAPPGIQSNSTGFRLARTQ